MPLQSEWFCTLLDTAQDVYFRFSLTPRRLIAIRNIGYRLDDDAEVRVANC